MKQYEWCSFTFDPENFPNPSEFLSALKTKYGVKICLWINPYISQLSPLFGEGVQGGFFVKRNTGGVWQWDLWQPGMAIVDFTNPNARAWYSAKLQRLLDLGVDCFKTDFGERIPHVNIVYHDGSDPLRMHNMYSILYNELVFTLLSANFGEHQAVVFARSSAVGGQRFPVHWGGDCESTYEAMGEALRGLISLNLSGFAFGSHDIGGFEGLPPAELYMRWLAFGIFSSHSRLHGSTSYRVPWHYGEDAAVVLANLLKMKHRLMPYLYYYSIEAHRKGHPLHRAMFVEFQSDRSTHHLDRQYLLGPYILVAPVLVSGSEATTFYIPEGEWTTLFSPSRTVRGPAWLEEVVPVDRIPVWIRPGAVLCLGPEDVDGPDYDYTTGLEVRIYELTDGQTVEAPIPTGKGAEIAGIICVTRSERTLIAKASSQTIKIEYVQLHFAGVEVVDVVGGTACNEMGRFKANQDTSSISFVLNC